LARASKEPKFGARLNARQRLAWLRLIRSENVGPATFRALVNQFSPARRAVNTLRINSFWLYLVIIDSLKLSITR